MHEEPGLKIVARRHGPLRRSLVICRNTEGAMLDHWARALSLLTPPAMTHLVELGSAALSEPRRIAGIRLSPSAAGRWFGVGTFVVDLGWEEEKLWHSITARERTKCRQAQRGGIRVDVVETPGENELQTFWRLYRPMALERGLQSPPLLAFRQMAADGHLMIAMARGTAGDPLVVNAIFRGHRQGFFLYGAGADHIPSGAGHLTHWETIRRLKALGERWYDLGHVASCELTDGIYRFKRSLGGTFAPFGMEYDGFTPRWFGSVIRLAAALSRLRRGR